MADRLQGVFAAAVTPVKADYSIDLDGIPRLLNYLSTRGCHGALLFGTTGEGPSFSAAERTQALRVAQDWRKSHRNFRLLAGTGTPSLEETIQLTRAALDLGFDGVVTLPPYYYRKVSDGGLFAWFSLVIQRAVPEGCAFLGYHFPSVSGVPLSIELLERLHESFPTRFAGIKDSSGDPVHAQALGQRFGEDLLVFNGNDRHFSLALDNHAAGCITAMANLYSLDLRAVWEGFRHGDSQAQAKAQNRLSAARTVMERYPPFPPLLKALLARQPGNPYWMVRPPLLPLPAESVEQVLVDLLSID